MSDFEIKAKKAVEHLKDQLKKLRTGRAATSLIEGIQVDYYGSMVPLIQLGMINAPEPRLLTVQVYDQGAVESVEKAIRTSELGLSPQREGNLLRINIPSLNEERRKEIVKKLGKMGEETKVAIRNLRREAIDVIKKQKELSEDDRKRSEGEIQKVTDKWVAEVDAVIAAKEKEVMEV
jgi:ribosome recycling factor